MPHPRQCKSESEGVIPENSYAACEMSDLLKSCPRTQTHKNWPTDTMNNVPGALDTGIHTRFSSIKGVSNSFL